MSGINERAGEQLSPERKTGRGHCPFSEFPSPPPCENAELSWLPWMRILPRHDLFGEKRLANLSEEKSLKVLSPEVFIEKDMCRGI